MSQSQSLSKYRTRERLLRDQDILAVRTLPTVQYFLEIIYDTRPDSFVLRSLQSEDKNSFCGDQVFVTGQDPSFRGQDYFLEISPCQRIGLLSRSHDMIEDRTPSERARSLSKDIA